MKGIDVMLVKSMNQDWQAEWELSEWRGWQHFFFFFINGEMFFFPSIS